MTPQLIFLFLFVPSLVLSSHDSAYPPLYCSDKDSCGGREGELIPPRKEVYGNGKIIDITHRITSLTPSGITVNGIGDGYLQLYDSMKNGSDYNFSIIKLPAHAGTHVDAPGHFYENYFEEGFDIDSLDLEVLNGPALLVDVPRDKNITAEVMKSLNIPKGVKRVLFRTLNTDRQLMRQKQFITNYVGFMKDGAQWLKDNTDIKLVGTDYLSVAAYDDLKSAHLVFLESREIILVEGLKLEDVEAGLYNVHCLPLRLKQREHVKITFAQRVGNLKNVTHKETAETKRHATSLTQGSPKHPEISSIYSYMIATSHIHILPWVQDKAITVQNLETAEQNIFHHMVTTIMIGKCFFDSHKPTKKQKFMSCKLYTKENTNVITQRSSNCANGLLANK
ncbi:cyclase [Artemisia annua]|uniref:Cyclase n=1 Tax=Artemisia annua TaxID=35608 RepID=A0A2U1N3U5_ARTAN|nr:cyclase [Artemisia annua]